MLKDSTIGYYTEIKKKERVYRMALPQSDPKTNFFPDATVSLVLVIRMPISAQANNWLTSRKIIHSK